MTAPIPQPTVFISYSQTSETYMDTVREFADRLIHSGVDVILDQYDLKRGDNLNAFMERSVTDARVTHVLALCDETYRERSEGRRGGVGTETTIISPKVYAQLGGAAPPQGTRAPRFIAVRFAPGNVIPAMFASSLYVDLSDPGSTHYGQEFESLLRTLHSRPARTKPPLGQLPAFLDAAPTVSSASAGQALLVLDAARGERWSQARVRLREYLATLEAEIQAMPCPILQEGELRGHYDDAGVQAALANALPLRDAFVNVVRALAPGAAQVGLVDELVAFFERAANVTYVASQGQHYTPDLYDYLDFMVDELLLYLTGALFQAGGDDALSDLLGRGFYVTRARNGQSGYIDYVDVVSYPARLADSVQRLKDGGSWILPVGHLLTSRVTPGALTHIELCQADAILWWRSMVGAERHRWYPQTVVYWGYATFPAFGRAESTRSAVRLAAVLGYNDVGSMKADAPRLMEAFRTFRNEISTTSVDVATVLNLSRLATRP